MFRLGAAGVLHEFPRASMARKTQTSDQRLRRCERLRGRRNFARVFNRKCSLGNSEIVLYVAPNKMQYARIGIVVTRRVGNAVARAKARRRIREFFRRTRQNIPPGYDYACIARPAPTREWTLSPGAAVGLFADAARKDSRREESGPFRRK